MSARPGRGLALLAAAALFALPLVFVLVVSLQPEGTGLGALALPDEPHWANYRVALERMGGFPRFLANTVLVTLVAVLGQCFTCSLAGYALARLSFRGRGLCFVLVLGAMMLPEQLGALPRFLLFRTLGLVDTFWPLVLPTVLGGAPFFVFLFRQYFRALPAELGEAARIDGCTSWQAYWRVFLPLARPMLATVALVTFLATWNDFWAPLLYLLSPENRTLTLALASFQRTYDTAVEHLMAASAVILAPCVLVTFLAQHLFLRGIRVAASKQ
ncbi:MAG TPA: carbohydrate ABC transporter permease [Planctomycetota bacterium]